MGRVNWAAGFLRLTAACSIVAGLCMTILVVLAIYLPPEPDTDKIEMLLLLTPVIAAVPWLLYAPCAWIAAGFTSTSAIPVVNKVTGEITLAGFAPGGDDFPFGGAHATFSPVEFDDAKCDRCGVSGADTVVFGVPNGFLCYKHGGWYSWRVFIGQCSMMIGMYALMFLGLFTLGYFVWLDKNFLPRAARLAFAGAIVFVVVATVDLMWRARARTLTERRRRGMKTAAPPGPGWSPPP